MKFKDFRIIIIIIKIKTHTYLKFSYKVEGCVTKNNFFKTKNWCRNKDVLKFKGQV